MGVVSLRDGFGSGVTSWMLTGPLLFFFSLLEAGLKGDCAVITCTILDWI